MPSRRLVAILTALLMLGTGSRALAAYSLDQLKEIEKLVMSRDTAALGAYLDAHPDITAGSDPLATELRNFKTCADDGGLSCFDAAKLPKAPEEPKRRVASTPVPVPPTKPTPGSTPTPPAIY